VTEPRPRIGVLVFPGSCDERDAAWALGALGAQPVLIWHAEEGLRGVDAVVLPGGFSYGDYLRCGAIARFSPAMQAVTAFAGEGGLVLGICNGFQILCEAGLLPGILRPNASLQFVCRDVNGRSSRSTMSGTSRQTKRRDSFRSSTPGRSPASQRIWKPLQMPSTRPPAPANSQTAAVAGEKRAIAPQRR
jgi:phosphoribosylformylglycinamidine (FGAM) synthase-like amidotransferase family enzyme